MRASVWPGVLGGVLFALGVATSSSCKTNGDFQCSKDADCVAAGADGRCEATNFCSFPDGSCPSGFRYPDDAAHDRAGQCADVDEAGTADAGGSSGATDGGPDSGPGGPIDDGVDSDDSAEDDAGGPCDLVGPLAECDPAVQTAPVPCADLGRGFDSGMADCTPVCSWDTSGCSQCGDDEIENDEVCDGPIAGRNCVSLGMGYTGGVLTCTDDCTAIDDSNCFTCGDDELQAGEVCDGALLGGTDCATLGYSEGPVACAADCLAFDTTMCTGVSCGVEPPAPPPPCPPECTSCEDGVCTIECDDRECEGQTVTCPPGRPCNVVCDGIDTCLGSTVVCPEYHACDLECDGIDSCDDLVLECGAVGSCGVDCQGFSCEGLNVECGADACLASCTTTQTVTVACGTSCSCTGECVQN
ncbi:MAG: hypothetical protein AAF721_07240 [Myxococcota bacterium]